MLGTMLPDITTGRTPPGSQGGCLKKSDEIIMTLEDRPVVGRKGMAKTKTLSGGNLGNLNNGFNTKKKSLSSNNLSGALNDDEDGFEQMGHATRDALITGGNFMGTIADEDCGRVLSLGSVASSTLMVNTPPPTAFLHICLFL